MTGKLALLVPWALLLAACATAGKAPSRRTPEDVVGAYVAALKAGQYQTAYDLTSTEFRKRHSKKTFTRLLKENPAALKQSLKQLQGTSRTTRVKALMEFGQGEALKLEVEQGKWRIASDPTNFYGQRSPEEALRSFVRAIESRRYDIVLKFVPAKWAEAMTVAKLKKQWEGTKQNEVKAMIKRLKDNLNSPIHKSGDRANMPYGDKFEVRFIRESGVWKIEDPD